MSLGKYRITTQDIRNSFLLATDNKRKTTTLHKLYMDDIKQN